MIKKAAIYARVSSKKQKEGDTIDSQVEALFNYANQKGYQIPESWIFLDNGVSGGTLQRSALDDLRDIIRSEPVNVLLIYAPDRLSRKYSHQLILLEEFRKNGVETCFLKDTAAGNTPEAVMLNHFQGIFAEYERALILDRSRRGRTYKAKQGNPCILPDVPHGYVKVKKEGTSIVEVIQTHADVVKRIFKLYVFEKTSLRGIAKILTLDCIKTPSGLSRWDVSTIRDILKNPAYTGTAYYGKTEKGEGCPDRIRHCKSGKFTQPKYAKRKLPQEKWLPISVPQLISESDFEMAQEQINKNKKLAERNTKQPALLQGLVMCGKCGNPFYKRFRKYKGQYKGYYYCRSHADKRLTKCSNGWARQPELDNLVYKEVLKLLQNPSIIKDELSRRSSESTNTEGFDKEEIIFKKELSKLATARDRLLDAYQSGVLELKELSQRNQQLDAHRNALEKKIKAIQALKMEKEVGQNLEVFFEHITKRMQQSAEDLPMKEKQKLVRLFVEKVVVDENQVKIIHCISPSLIIPENCQLSGDRRI